ncbi:MAG: 1,4-alpha-glucan-branching protein [Bacteroidetes bacterium]|nr:MAG: 1,4-alpha-glucan-branching protein [Bacteroidota bacterium]
MLISPFLLFNLEAMLKRCLLFCLLIQSCILSSAQLLTVNPSFPTDTSSVIIIADCSKGNQGLFNYTTTSDVYVHIGVITNLSVSHTDWRYVKFNQNFNLPNPALQASYLGNNKYAFQINNIRNYFGVPAGETILKIAILFRNGNGTSVLRNSDGSDMFISVSNGTFQGEFTSPPMQPLYNPSPEPINKNVGDSIAVRYITNRPASMYLYFNGNLVDSIQADTVITGNPIISAAGSQQIIVRSNDGTTVRQDTISFYSSASTNIAPLPSGVQDGINYLAGDTSAILVLFAPGKNKAVVLGDFNNWTASPPYQMNQTPDGKYFWIQLNGLTPSVEYAYQFLIDNSLKVADYYTEKILDPDNDPSISSSTYPNLKAYPTGKTTGIVSILQTKPSSYTWSASSYNRPDKSGLNIYEILVRDFTVSHDYKALRDTLNYLQSLGVNAIELMPINEFEGNSSWGYNPSFYFAPDKYYGPKNSLKALIDSCHNRGMAVIMDIVLNHSYGKSPMVQMYFNEATGQPAADNPWYNVTAPHQSIQFGYDFNHSSDATKYFVDRVTKFWLTEYKMDGFRFDFTKGFTQKQTTNDNDLSAYDTGRVNILTRIHHAIESVDPNAYVILEHFAANQEEQVLAADGMMLWGNGNYNFNQATMGYLDNNGSDFSQSIYTARGYTQPNLVSYMESHDEERLMYKNIKYGNQAGNYIIKGDTANSLKRNAMASAFYLSIPGPKMIWQFGELGYDYSRCYQSTNGDGGDCNTKTDPKPIRWDYLSQPNRRNLHDVNAAMLKLRNRAPALSSSSLIQYNLSGAFKSLQVSSTQLNLSVIGDFDVNEANGNLTFQHAGIWYDYLTGDSLLLSSTTKNFMLAPGEYHVFLDKNMRDSLGLLPDTSVASNNLLIKIYPNPVVSANTFIRYETPQDANNRLSIYDMMGRKIFSLNKGMEPKGVHICQLSQLFLNPLLLADGVYVLELVSNQSRAHMVFVVQH